MRPITAAELTVAMSQSEVDNLKDGTPITVFWGGGNGPCEYVTKRSPYSVRTLAVYVCSHTGQHTDVGALDFVGRGKMNHKVILNATRTDSFGGADGCDLTQERKKR